MNEFGYKFIHALEATYARKVSCLALMLKNNDGYHYFLCLHMSVATLIQYNYAFT